PRPQQATLFPYTTLFRSREGYRWFDFGRSKRETGSFHFKSGWSMKVEDLPYRYYLARAKEVPQLSPIDSAFRLPVALWKKLPFPDRKSTRLNSSHQIISY